MKTLLSLLLSFVLACGVYAQTADKFFEQGKNAYNKNNYEEAIELFTKAIEKGYSLLEVAYYYRGKAKSHSGKSLAAVQDYNKAIELNPKDEEFYNVRAIAKDGLGKYIEAIQDYDKAIELRKPYTSYAYHNNRGDTHIALGNYEKAIEDFSIVLAGKRTFYDYYNKRGYAHFKLQNYAKAIEDWEAMQKVAPADYKPPYNYIDEARKKLAENNTIVGLQKQLEEEKKKNEQVALLPSTHSKRLALVIGNNDYLNNSSLANAKNDATDMQQRLKELGFEVMYYTNLKKTELEKAVYDFGAKLTKYDAGLVFYAGHGIEYKEENYLIPVDAKLQFETLVKNECVDVSLIINNMEGARSKVNVIMLDACRDNPFVRSWKSAGRNIQNNGFVEIKAEDSQSLVVMFATSRGQTASDGENCNGNKRNGLFTGQLLPNLQKGVRIEDVFKRTKKAVRECSEGKQIPWNLNSLEGDFVF